MANDLRSTVHGPFISISDLRFMIFRQSISQSSKFLIIISPPLPLLFASSIHVCTLVLFFFLAEPGMPRPFSFFYYPFLVFFVGSSEGVRRLVSPGYGVLGRQEKACSSGTVDG